MRTRDPASSGSGFSSRASALSEMSNTSKLSTTAPPFFSPLMTSTFPILADSNLFSLTFYNSLDKQYRELGQTMFERVFSYLQSQGTSSIVDSGNSNSISFRAAKITGMILELRFSQIQYLLGSEQALRLTIDEAAQALATTIGIPRDMDIATDPGCHDNAPLFWQPNKKASGAGFYSPRAGKNSPSRLNAFRNVGRIIGICLLQNELCPIQLSRHVVKYILNRPIRWHDLAFYDSQMYESFRKMINDAESQLVYLFKLYLGELLNNNSNSNSASSDLAEEEMTRGETTRRTTVPRQLIKEALIKATDEINEQIFKPLDLTFNIDLPKEESSSASDPSSGGEGATSTGISSSSLSSSCDLIENGSKILVNCFNMYEFVKRYCEFRMQKNIELCLEQLKLGIYDVLPGNAFDGLNAEDFRLLLNGVADINVHTLASYTTIIDESKSEMSRRSQFEKWFWTTVERMNQQEKQELLFFWTGSPYLPASEEGFQPLPTITLRPPSDQHLPTANTCINRLYVPMYSSKSILKSKMLQAIKTKTFGFV